MAKSLRGVILNPQADRSVELLADGVLQFDDDQRLTFVGNWTDFAARFGENASHENAVGVIVPAMFDLHTHVPQFPIRGDFSKGIALDDPRGVLLASLEDNVYPAELAFSDLSAAESVIRSFAADTRANGVIGGSAFLTAHPAAARRALEILPQTWRAGLVLMNQQCPSGLCTPDAIIDDVAALGRDFGERHVVTDRFAVATTSELRRRAADVARRYGLMTQTHLNEQVSEKRYVETLYPQAKSYADLYLSDGLLDTRAILAHCIQMTPAEWDILTARRCVVAHCPTSNADLDSGIMSLDEVIARQIEYAICTDVGASPTTSLMAEMAVFLLAHRGRSRHATACEALYRTTLGPARILGLDHSLGQFKVGMRAAFSQWALPAAASMTSAEDLLRNILLPADQTAGLPTDELTLTDLRSWIRARRDDGQPKPLSVSFG